MKPVTHRSWRAREADAEAVCGLTRAGVAPLLARLLAHRGVCAPDDADAYLNPVLSRLHDPMLMTGMEQAVARLVQALKAGERVCVHGDYDVDGVTSCAVLISFFQKIGLDCCHYIPKRLTEGYGLSEQGVTAATRAGATVLVTVDCGITAVNEARLCREAGVDLIVTDHHSPGEELPDACAVINPLQPGCPFPFKSLAGVGVAFHLVVALRARLRADGCFKPGAEPDLKEYLDLVALGTIADVVPLLGINRVLVTYGLKQLCAGTRVGVEALKEVAGITGEVGCGAVGFRLAPRINAAGRLEDAALGLELLLCRDPQRARDIARELDEANAERQALERATFEEARAMLEQGACSGRKSIVLGSEEWHPGVIGIVASRIVELFHRPVILFAFDGATGRGSGRSISRFHLLDAIKECADHLLRFGGHSHAAGLSIAQEELERFALRFDEAAQELDADALTPTLPFDLELDGDEITADLVRQLEQMKPFGMGNPEPLFVLKGAQVLDSRVLKGGHLKLKVGQGGRSFDAIGFGLAEAGVPQGNVDVLFSPGINVWNGRSSLQLTVKDLRPEGTC
ncbi:single-stranded-DNA-specific exonuclease RecJ [Geomonas anaerohicana]|uniref:Single-stranded-DNA-specific exonuclease RecJ n=1 Tax=Geomonas anaerohicana TaxID=2798583 RepID=A0ABS0YFR9_9BACT|nr:single-stranded-DNA-specific exonuclease RecJ [Geomonas anaerohicana]MBJ6751163.1 single-stranded-DNA-specific exonuclease RecJ [Geomonas anaerohicana]